VNCLFRCFVFCFVFCSRFIFEKAGVPLPDGIPEVFNQKDLVLGLNTLWKRNPKQNKIVIKLNEGISGEGNVVLNLYKLHSFVDADDATRLKALDEAVRNIKYHVKVSWHRVGGSRVFVYVHLARSNALRLLLAACLISLSLCIAACTSLTVYSSSG
jgi:hypothetical protein